MTATVAPTVSVTTTTEPDHGPSLWRAGATSGVLAAVATSVVATVALAADVPLEIAGEQIPVLGFAQLTLIGAVLGVLIAKAAHRWAADARRAFVRVTVALTALSLVPDLTADATTATIGVLMATHVVAAAIVIPRLADRL